MVLGYLTVLQILQLRNFRINISIFQKILPALTLTTTRQIVWHAHFRALQLQVAPIKFPFVIYKHYIHEGDIPVLKSLQGVMTHTCRCSCRHAHFPSSRVDASINVTKQITEKLWKYFYIYCIHLICVFSIYRPLTVISVPNRSSCQANVKTSTSSKF